jgi:hypothetical protein
MTFIVKTLQTGQINISYDWAFDKEATDALALFGELSVQRGENLERKRIIKLLETDALKPCDEDCGYRCECFAKYEAIYFIKRIQETAFIKKESK